MRCLKIMRLLAATMVTVSLAACSTGEGSPAGAGAPDELGPYAVGHTSFMLVDAARDDRELPVDVWYPVDDADAATQYQIELQPNGPTTLVTVNNTAGERDTSSTAKRILTLLEEQLK